MHIINPKDAATFLDHCGAALCEDEINSNLIFGLSKNLIKNKFTYGNEEPFFCIAYNKNDISIAALITPPRNLIVYEYKNVNDEVIKQLVKNVHTQFEKLPGINGELGIAKRIAEQWVNHTGCKHEIKMNLRVYKLINVLEYKKPSGSYRFAVQEDFDTIKNFGMEFSAEINEPFSNERNIEWAASGINNKEFLVWDDKGIVSMAKRSRPSQNGMAIAAVYTPPGHRKKGYASAVVAELCRDTLESGKTFCTLFTDLSNPTSNSIYQKIGFSPVCDHISYSFEY
ncbi:MAG: GNAT family N-acetyltransferase [Treponema sp.]|nr:GNAT family N-acetyltransferase [Treponema sp.]